MARAAAAEADLYERDFFAWTRAQAAELRRLAGRLPASLDVARLAEEIEDLGKSERDACRSQVRRIVEHLLKLGFAGDRGAERQWRLSVDDARDVLGDKLTPALRHDLAAGFARLYAQGRRRAVRSLVEFAEADAERRLPATPPFGLDQVLAEDWYPPRA